MLFSAITLFKLVKMPTNCDDCYKWADSLDDGTDPTNQIWMGNMNKCYKANNCEQVLFPVN